MKPAKKILLILAFLLFPAAAPCSKDLTDYPLKVEILANHWDRCRPRPVRDPAWWVYRLSGQGNIIDGSAEHAFDFKYENTQVVCHTLANQSYPARWKKPQQELELLMPDVGHPGKYFACELDTLVCKGVYVQSSQGVVEISQEDYKAGKIPGGGSGTGQAAPPATSKLSVESNPASADIEVDGEFVGTTPSVFDLTPGQHTITLHKTGYKAWQKKMELLAGEITLNLDLEPASAK